MSVWCVAPETEKIDLVFKTPDGQEHPFWIAVRKRLTSGEARTLRHAGWRGLRERDDAPADPKLREPQIEIDWASRTRARVEAYLADWSLTNDTGGRLPVSSEVLDSLDDALFELIDDEILAHMNRVAEEKKRPSIASVSLEKSA
jgi:hypothetical protein